MSELPPLAPHTEGIAGKAGAANARRVTLATVAGAILLALALAVALLRFRQLTTAAIKEMTNILSIA